MEQDNLRVSATGPGNSKSGKNNQALRQIFEESDKDPLNLISIFPKGLARDPAAQGSERRQALSSFH